jgi:hypothetical protein
VIKRIIRVFFALTIAVITVAYLRALLGIG